MAEYFLKPALVERAYRLTYEDNGGKYRVSQAHVCAGAGATTLPSGQPVIAVEQQADISEVVVDLILGNVVAGAVADYRTVAKAQVDASW